LRESWTAKTTANNLSLIREARVEARRDVGRISDIIEALEAPAKG
jgi:hypothetical protein